MNNLTELSDADLVARFQDIEITEQACLASKLEHLAEMDAVVRMSILSRANDVPVLMD